MAGSSYKGSEIKSVDQFISGDGLDFEREKEIGQHIGYRHDVNLLPDYARLTPFLEKYMELRAGATSTGSRTCTWATSRVTPR